jgi:hypothetical protein
MDILALFQCLQSHVTATILCQLSLMALAMLVLPGRVTMLGLSRWASKGGSYRTVQRFFSQVLPWAMLFWVFFRQHVHRPEEVYLLAGDEVGDGGSPSTRRSMPQAMAARRGTARRRLDRRLRRRDAEGPGVFRCEGLGAGRREKLGEDFKRHCTGAKGRNTPLRRARHLWAHADVGLGEREELLATTGRRNGRRDRRQLEVTQDAGNHRLLVKVARPGTTASAPRVGAFPSSRYPSWRSLRMTRRLIFWTTCATSASLGGSALTKRGLRRWSVRSR